MVYDLTVPDTAQLVATESAVVLSVTPALALPDTVYFFILRFGLVQHSLPLSASVDDLHSVSLTRTKRFLPGW